MIDMEGACVRGIRSVERTYGSMNSTKQELIAVAIPEFGKHGFEAVGTRAIADQAGAALSAITYHFGSKHGLYLACAEHIAERLATALSQVDYERGEPKDKAEAIALCKSIVGAMCRIMTSPESEAWSLFIVREQQNPTDALGLIGEQTIDPVFKTLGHCIAICRPELREDERITLAALLFGMPTVMRNARAGLARQFGVDDLEPVHHRLFEQQIGSLVEKALDC